MVDYDRCGPVRVEVDHEPEVTGSRPVTTEHVEHPYHKLWSYVVPAYAACIEDIIKFISYSHMLYRHAWQCRRI